MMKFALIGCGLWGAVILRDLVQLGNQVNVIELDSQHAADALSLGAERVSKELKDITNADAVIIATPASTHAEIIHALDAMGNMLPIFCEKPLVDSSAHARGLLLRSGPPLFVMHIWRYHPGVIKLRELYTEGCIGALTQFKSLRANWTSPRTDVDTLMNMAPHDLSILQFLLGRIPPVISATAERINGEIKSCLAILKDPDGPSCIVEVSNRYAEKRREVRMHGVEGVLVLPNDTDGEILLTRAGGSIFASNVNRFSYEKRSAMQQQLCEIMDYLKTGDDRKLCSAKAGAEVVQALDQIKALT